MILRRITEHVKAQNWTAVALDFFIVVVGVFVGIQVSHWNAARIERKLEQTYIVRLHDEGSALENIRSHILFARQDNYIHLRAATAILFEDPEPALSVDQCAVIGTSLYISNPTDDLAIIIELLSSGRITLFRDEALSDAVGALLLTRARARDSQSGIALQIKDIPALFPNLVMLVDRYLDDDEELVRTAFTCRPDLMKSDQSFLNVLARNLANMQHHVRDNENVTASLARLHAVLDEIFAITHEKPSL